MYKTFLIELGDRHILEGDFNAKHTDRCYRVSLIRGKELRQAIRELEYKFPSSGSSTYWPSYTNKILHLIDFFLFPKGITKFHFFLRLLKLSEKNIEKIIK